MDFPSRQMNCVRNAQAISKAISKVMATFMHILLNCFVGIQIGSAYHFYCRFVLQKNLFDS